MKTNVKVIGGVAVGLVTGMVVGGYLIPNDTIKNEAYTIPAEYVESADQMSYSKNDTVALLGIVEEVISNSEVSYLKLNVGGNIVIGFLENDRLLPIKGEKIEVQGRWTQDDILMELEDGEVNCPTFEISYIE